MITVRSAIKDNQSILIIPKEFNIKPGTEYYIKQEKDGSLLLTPINKMPNTLEELFYNWHGEYQMPKNLSGWQSENPKGNELW